MSDEITVGSAQFRVMLGQMEDAIGTLEHQQAQLATARDNIKKAFDHATQSWDSPAADGFKDLLPQVTGNMDDLLGALDTIHGRLKTTHQNYLDAEQANSSTLAPPASGPKVTSVRAARPAPPPHAKPEKPREAEELRRAAETLPVREAMRTEERRGQQPV
jgi:WXG100 family type VII secretion target